MVSETGSAFSMRMTSWERSHGKEQVKGKNTGKEQVFPPRKVSWGKKRYGITCWKGKMSPSESGETAKILRYFHSVLFPKPQNKYCTLTIYVEFRKRYRWTYLQSRNRDTDIENKHMDTKKGKEWDELGNWDQHIHITDCCCSVTKSCPTLCDPMDCNMPGSSVLHCLSEFDQYHVHGVGDASPQCYGPWRRYTIDTIYEIDD